MDLVRLRFTVRLRQWTAIAFASAGLFVGSTLPAFAWGPTGHMAVAQIAYDSLSPSTRAEVDRIDTVLQNSEPRFGHLIPAAVWPDALRQRGIRAFDRWHYVNLPLDPEGLGADRPIHHDNVVWAIREAERVVGDPDSPDLWRAIMLRMLVHLVGDAHQPLHCVSRYSVHQLDGDRGGNDLPILDGDRRHRNLHLLWDDMLGLYPRIEPEGSGWREQLPRLVEPILERVPAESRPVLDPEAWAEEGRRLAREAVYDGIRFEATPSAAYLERGRGVVDQQIARAGRRLGALLERLLGPPTSDQTAETEARAPSATAR